MGNDFEKAYQLEKVHGVRAEVHWNDVLRAHVHLEQVPSRRISAIKSNMLFSENRDAMMFAMAAHDTAGFVSE